MKWNEEDMHLGCRKAICLFFHLKKVCRIDFYNSVTFLKSYAKNVFDILLIKLLYQKKSCF